MTDETETGGGEGMKIDVDLVRQLAVLLDETNLTEIEVEDGSRKIRVARTAPPVATMMAAPAVHAAAPAAAPASPPPAGSVANTPAPPSVSPADHPGAVKSPMVGTAYLAAEPGAAPFIAVGTRVAAGDTLLIVEAMKVMNPIPSPRAGTVTQLFIDNGQPVEFDQPLVVIE